MNLVALTRAVAWVDYDRQMAQALNGGNNAQVERVARVIGESSHSALAQDHLVIAFRENIFGGHQEFLERIGHTALQQYWLARAAGAAQQREILHIARADLNAVGAFFH